jgi:hypothetical protein
MPALKASPPSLCDFVTLEEVTYEIPDLENVVFIAQVCHIDAVFY